MTVIAFVFAASAVLVALLLAAADPVLLSRLNGRPAEGGSGRHIPVSAEPSPAPAAAGVAVPAPRRPAPAELRSARLVG